MLQGAVNMRSSLRMDGDNVRPCIGKGIKIGIDWRDHQMDIERLVGVWA